MAKTNRLKNYSVELDRIDFLVENFNTSLEYYIDPKTKRVDENNHPLKYPIVSAIASTDKFVFYICPNCGEIHAQQKREFNIPNPIIETSCPHVSGYKVIFSTEDEPIAHERVLPSKFERELKFVMEEFEKPTRDRRKGSRRLP